MDQLRGGVHEQADKTQCPYAPRDGSQPGMDWLFPRRLATLQACLLHPATDLKKAEVIWWRRHRVTDKVHGTACPLWVKSGHPQRSPVTSAIGGQADMIRSIADMLPLNLRFLAECGLSSAPLRTSACSRKRTFKRSSFLPPQFM